MFRTLALVPICVSCVPLEAQSANAATNEARAAALRTLLGEAPGLALEPLALSAHMPNAANLGIVSSVATDHSGTV